VTKRQKQCLDFILNFWESYDYGPSYQEISDGLGMKNKSGAYRIVNLLCARGRLKKYAGRARSIYPLEHKV
jgi:SOS-response transcriptional repressor LexA